MTTPLRAAPEVIVAHLDGEAVLLHLGSKRYFRLNDSAAAIWRGIEEGADAPAIVGRLLREFDVPPHEAEREVSRVLAALVDDALVTAAG